MNNKTLAAAGLLALATGAAILSSNNSNVSQTNTLPISTIGYFVNGYAPVTYSSDPSAWTWFVEYSENVQGPYSYCPDCRYQGGTIYIGFRPNHYYRLHGFIDTNL